MAANRPLKILIAPNPFKECLSADEVARALAHGARTAGATVRCRPMADGGPGTLAALRRPLGLRFRRSRVRDPRGEIVSALWGYNAATRTAVVETAEAIGLERVPPDRRRILESTSFGAGELIGAALDAGARTLWVGLGGSATVDGGLGALQALGAQLGRRGESLPRSAPLRARDLLMLTRVDLVPVRRRCLGVRLEILGDVRNPMTGDRGAARIFGPQKGASPAEVRVLEGALRRWARLSGRRGLRLSGTAGSGAAGGLGFALALVGGRRASGARRVMELGGLEADIRWADAVWTGEGRVDGTTGEGKAPESLRRAARRAGKPCVIFAGSLGEGAENLSRRGARIHWIGAGYSTDESRRRAKELLRMAAEREAALLIR